MRPGQVPRPVYAENDSFTKQQLLDASGLSSKTFDLIRKVARVKGPNHGSLNWEFTRDQIEALIHAAAGGRFTERGGPAAEGWRKLLTENPSDISQAEEKAAEKKPRRGRS